MKSLKELLEIYRMLLNCLWPKIQVFGSHIEGEYMLNDWKQVNWELLVESNLCEKEKIYLEPYGEGADYYGESSRILQPQALPTHAVWCHAEGKVTDLLAGKAVDFPKAGLALECFVAMRDGWYYEEPPFDCVLIVRDVEQLVVKMEEINFELVKIS